jgi:hypothetical protein
VHWSYFFPSVHNLVRYSEMFWSFVHFLFCKGGTWLQSRVQALGFVCIFFLAREIGHGEIGHFVFLLHLTLKFVLRFGPFPFTLLVLLVLHVFFSGPSF